MPALTFLAVVGLALIALLFVADATLEPSSPPIVTSNRVGLPEPWHPDSMDPGAIRNLTTAPAPALDMASDLVRAAMPKAQAASEDDLAKVTPAARAAGLRPLPRRSASPARSRRSSTDRTTPGRTESLACLATTDSCSSLSAA
jgi:hypothetical protein